MNKKTLLAICFYVVAVLGIEEARGQWGVSTSVGPCFNFADLVHSRHPSGTFFSEFQGAGLQGEVYYKISKKSGFSLNYEVVNLGSFQASPTLKPLGNLVFKDYYRFRDNSSFSNPNYNGIVFIDNSDQVRRAKSNLYYASYFYDLDINSKK